jgi:hypothetical protein
LIWQTVLERRADVEKLPGDRCTALKRWGRSAGPVEYRLPQARQVRLTVGGSRAGSGEIGFSIWRSRNTRSRIVEPLARKRGKKKPEGEQP